MSNGDLFQFGTYCFALGWILGGVVATLYLQHGLNKINSKKG